MAPAGTGSRYPSDAKQMRARYKMIPKWYHLIANRCGARFDSSQALLRSHTKLVSFDIKKMPTGTGLPYQSDAKQMRAC